MQKNKQVKNVKEYVKKVNMYLKIYKVTSNRNVKPNKRIYKSNKDIEISIKIHIYKHENKQIYSNACREIFKEYIKNKS